MLPGRGPALSGAIEEVGLHPAARPSRSQQKVEALLLAQRIARRAPVGTGHRCRRAPQAADRRPGLVDVASTVLEGGTPVILTALDGGNRVGHRRQRDAELAKAAILVARHGDGAARLLAEPLAFHGRDAGVDICQRRLPLPSHAQSKALGRRTARRLPLEEGAGRVRDATWCPRRAGDPRLRRRRRSARAASATGGWCPQ